MNTNKYELRQRQIVGCMLLVVLFAGFHASAVAAQGSGSSSGGGGAAAGVQDQDRDQDRDRIQDPTTHDDDEPDQDRDRERDQDRLHTTSTSSGVEDQIIFDDHEIIQVQTQGRVSTPEQLEAVIVQTRNQLQEQEKNLGDSVQNIYRNQNQVRVAATALASSSDMLGPLGSAVNRIANDYKASVEATIKAEERIQNRSRINSFLFGGDDDAVAELNQQYQQHQLRIQELKRLINVWEGDQATKDLLQEQIQTMEREQLRLRQVADQENSSRGLFDYLLFWRN